MRAKTQIHVLCPFPLYFSSVKRAAHKMSAEDAEDAILGPLSDGGARMLQPRDKDPDGEGADEGRPATGGGASSTGGGVESINLGFVLINLDKHFSETAFSPDSPQTHTS